MALSRTNSQPTADYVICTSGTRPTGRSGLMIFETDTKLVFIRNVANTAWIQVTPEAATVDTQESTSSTSFTALTTPGPAVSVETGTKALVTVGSAIIPGGTAYGFAGFAVSGASTVAATDNTSIYTGAAGSELVASKQSLVTGLTAGVNTFTMQYKVGSGTFSFKFRNIIVEALPE